MIIVTGCERSGTTFIAQQIAEKEHLPYVHEIYASKKAVIKHSLNLRQGIKHLELLDYLYPNARRIFVFRDGREVCRSLVQKIWKRRPYTMSLEEAITQWNHVNKTCSNWAEEFIYYESYVNNPIITWSTFFTKEQINYMWRHLDLKKYGYIK